MKTLYGLILILLIIQSAPTLTYANNTVGRNINEWNLENKVNEFMNKQTGSNAPGAAVVVVKDGEVIFSKGYGYADLENKTPVDFDKTVFEYGSISKLFTWVSVMQLVEQGKMKLDEDIKNYLPPDFVSKLKYNQPITMLNLMSHTAGFEEQPFDWLPFYPDGKITPLEEYLTKHQPMQVYKPGEVIAYSNYGVALAGLAVEYISGEPFYEYERNHIFTPLEMNLISGNPMLADEPEIYTQKSKGYMRAGNSEFNESIWTYMPEYPAGSVNGTIKDLSLFLRSLTPETSQNTRLFQNRTTLDEMLSQSYTPVAGMPSNAHGFWEYESDYRYLYHPGETASFTGMIAFSLEKRFGFAILANAAEANNLVYGLSELLLGSSESLTAQNHKEGLPDANVLSGDYLLSMSCYNNIFEAICHLTNRVKVQATGLNELAVEIGGQKAEYFQISPYYFKLKNAPDSVTSFMDRHLYFEMQDGRVKRISSGNMDMVPFRSGRSVVLFWSSVIPYAASLLFFIISTIVLLIIWIRGRIKLAESYDKFRKQIFLLFVFTLLGTILLFNNTYVIYLALTDFIHDWQKFRMHIMINWGMLFVIIVFGFYGLYRTNFYGSDRRLKIFAFVNYAVIVATIFLLYNWHFFNLAI